MGSKLIYHDPEPKGIALEYTFEDLKELAIELNKYIPLNINGGIKEPLYSLLHTLRKHHPNLQPYDYKFQIVEDELNFPQSKDGS